MALHSSALPHADWQRCPVDEPLNLLEVRKSMWAECWSTRWHENKVGVISTGPQLTDDCSRIPISQGGVQLDLLGSRRWFWPFHEDIDERLDPLLYRAKTMSRIYFVLVFRVVRP
jgi:hypothetical protein